MTPERRKELDSIADYDGPRGYLREALDALTAVEQERDALRVRAEAAEAKLEEILEALPGSATCKHPETGESLIDNIRDLVKFRQTAVAIADHEAVMQETADDRDAFRAALEDERMLRKAAEARYAGACEALQKIANDGNQEGGYLSQIAAGALSVPAAQRALRIRECERAVEEAATRVRQIYRSVINGEYRKTDGDAVIEMGQVAHAALASLNAARKERAP